MFWNCGETGDGVGNALLMFRTNAAGMLKGGIAGNGWLVGMAMCMAGFDDCLRWRND